MRRSAILLFAAAAGLAACDGDGEPPPPVTLFDADPGPRDAGEPPDAGPPETDAGPGTDAGRVLSVAGRPCVEDIDCVAGLHCANGFPSPFCTTECLADADCRSGTACYGGECVPTCRTDTRGCDAVGGACLVTDVSLCVPSCSGVPGARCVGARGCSSYTGYCVGTPTTGGRDVGEPCAAPADCRSGQCLPEVDASGPTGWVDGYCVAITRSNAAAEAGDVVQGGCPPGSAIFPYYPEGDASLCMRTCTSPSSCRPGYYCAYPDGASGRTGFCYRIDCDTAGVPACPASTLCQEIDPPGFRGCVRCTPDCAGRECGDDGCGGSCGTCPTSAHTCDPAGMCQCTAQTDAELCMASGRECGGLTVVDRCGVTRTIASCGTCSAPETCGGAMLGVCSCVPETDVELCTIAGATCGGLGVLDRCGTFRSPSCGTCPAGSICGPTNSCSTCTPETDLELCAGVGATCGSLGVFDRCGTSRNPSCGTCPSGSICDPTNNCAVCTPTCTGVCGPDGCGGSCGSCGPTETCTGGACVPAPCDPVTNALCAPGDRCHWDGSATTCIPEGPGTAGANCIVPGACAAEHECSTELICREYCDLDSDCSSGVCAFNLTGSPYGLCSRPCSPTTGAGCDPFEACRVLDTATRSEVTDCRADGTVFPGSACAAQSDCIAGYACVGTCEELCLLGTSCSSGPCAGVAGWTTYGVCP